MKRRDRLTRKKRIQTKAASDAAANAPTSDVSATYLIHDKLLDFRIEASGMRERIPCKAGCAHCCDQMVLIYAPEAAEIVAQYPEVVKSVLPELERHDNLAMELGITSNVVNVYSRDPIVHAERSAFLARWFEHKTPCAFLGPDKRCRIYKARPLNCRNYLVFDQDPEVCGMRGEEGKKVRLQLFTDQGSYGGAASVLEQISVKALGGVAIGPLAALVCAAYKRFVTDAVP